MRMGIRGTRFLAPRTRGRFRPRAERLEDKLLLTDLGGTSPPNIPAIATAPFGVDLAGGQSNGGAGFSVTDIGDINSDGFDDFVIGAPTVINPPGGHVNLGVGGNSRAYLVFGSRAVNAGNIDWLTLNLTGQRVGDLSQLGNISQQNPITGATGFLYDGITFITSQNTQSQLGASVAPAGIINGTPAFLIGAPGAGDATGPLSNPGTGRAYLIYGGSGLTTLTNKQIDLDNTTGNQGVTFVTFVNSGMGISSAGRSVAGVGDFFSDTLNDIAIGAPGATINGNTGAGAVFVLDGSAVPTTTTTVNLNTVGQTGGRRGVIFGGSASGANVGFSVAGAGSVDGTPSGFGSRIPDLLIGAPGINSAYLIYGGTGIINAAAVVGGVNQIQLSRIAAAGTATDTVVGAVFQGNPGDGTGFSVASAGDFNGDGLADILIGSPNFQADTGRVSLIFGEPQSGTPLVGNIALNTVTQTFPSVQFVGTAAGDLAGYSVSGVGLINASRENPILIGSPGFNANSGAAYLIPGGPALFGVVPLSTATSTQVGAQVLTFTTPGGVSPPFFGASVSGRPISTRTAPTADSDAIADYIIGAPGYQAANGRGLDGGAMIIEGRFTPLAIPTGNAITTQIGVGTAFGPFTVNPSTPNTLQIFVFSNATLNPAFDPVRDIDPTTVVVNGVAFPNATIAKDPVDENKDGIEDAIITISPRSNIGLTASTTTFTISGRTLASSPNAGKVWIGTAAITVTGGGGGGGGAGGAAGFTAQLGAITPTTFVPPFGPDRYTPSLTTLSLLSYKPIPARIAIQQFLPPVAFRERNLNFFFPSKFHFQGIHSSGHRSTSGGRWSLGQHILDTSRFHGHNAIVYTHRGPVIPINLQRELAEWP